MRNKINLLLAFILAFTTILPSMAFGNTADVAGTPYQDSVTRLITLGIVEGYPDGSFKPNNEITRAEFAKIIITATGNQTAADILKGTAPFKDVKKDHWASGFIAAAASLGYVKGYNGNAFKPDANINSQEVVTVLLRAAGYTDNLPGNWPLNYLIKANEVGILKDSTNFVAAGNANRGLVAQLTSKLLDVEVVKYDKDKNDFIKEATGAKDKDNKDINTSFIAKRLASKFAQNDVTKTAFRVGVVESAKLGSKKEFVIEEVYGKDDYRSLGEKTYKFSDDNVFKGNLGALYGQKVNFLVTTVNSDPDNILNRVVYFAPAQEATRVISGKVGVAYSANGTKITVGSAEIELLSTTGTFSLNSGAFQNSFAIAKDTEVTVFTDKNGKARLVLVNRYTDPKEVNLVEIASAFTTVTFTDRTTARISKDARVAVNGENKALADIKKGQFLYLAYQNNLIESTAEAVIALAFDKTAEGTLTFLNSDAATRELSIETTKYKFITGLNTANLVVGKKYKVTLGLNNDVTKILSTDATAAYDFFYGAVTKAKEFETQTVENGRVNKQSKIEVTVIADGKEKTFVSNLPANGDGKTTEITGSSEVIESTDYTDAYNVFYFENLAARNATTSVGRITAVDQTNRTVTIDGTLYQLSNGLKGISGFDARDPNNCDSRATVSATTGIANVAKLVNQRVAFALNANKEIIFMDGEGGLTVKEGKLTSLEIVNGKILVDDTSYTLTPNTTFIDAIRSRMTQTADYNPLNTWVRMHRDINGNVDRLELVKAGITFNTTIYDMGTDENNILNINPNDLTNGHLARLGNTPNINIKSGCVDRYSNVYVSSISKVDTVDENNKIIYLDAAKSFGLKIDNKTNIVQATRKIDQTSNVKVSVVNGKLVTQRVGVVTVGAPRGSNITVGGSSFYNDATTAVVTGATVEITQNQGATRFLTDVVAVSEVAPNTTYKVSTINVEAAADLVKKSLADIKDNAEVIITTDNKDKGYIKAIAILSSKERQPARWGIMTAKGKETILDSSNKAKDQNFVTITGADATSAKLINVTDTVATTTIATNRLVKLTDDNKDGDFETISDAFVLSTATTKTKSALDVSTTDNTVTLAGVTHSYTPNTAAFIFGWNSTDKKYGFTKVNIGDILNAAQDNEKGNKAFKTYAEFVQNSDNVDIIVGGRKQLAVLILHQVDKNDAFITSTTLSDDLKK